MARYKDYNYDQLKMIPVSFDKQILPGSFEYSLSYLIDHELDLSSFDSYYSNDNNGRPAYDPRLLLKIVLLAYSKGITSSRRIERLCRENITFMALSADLRPDHSTLADFVSRSPEPIAELFSQVVLMCDQLGLIGKEMFAIDGCKLPANASKSWSGTHAELDKKCRKIDRAVRRMVQRHRDQDALEQQSDIQERECDQIRKLRAASRKIKQFLDSQPVRRGVSGKEVKSNITDNESAKMKTSHGVIQGYTGVAAVDNRHQVVIHAEAFGQGQEHGRSRDPRFKDHKAPKSRNRRKEKQRFTQAEFSVDRQRETCRCPAGHAMWLKARNARIGRYRFMQFQAYEKDCAACGLKSRCLRNPQQTTPRQINIALGTTAEHKESMIERMKRKIDSPRGRYIYSQRLGTVEPVFGHITDAIGIRRFSFRGKRKVDGQWKLMMMLHNILKIHRYGWEWG